MMVDLDKVANDGVEEILLADCEFDVSPKCVEEVVGMVELELLTGDPKVPETQKQYALVCSQHFEMLQKLDAARPLFWQVTQVTLLRAPAV